MIIAARMGELGRRQNDFIAIIRSLGGRGRPFQYSVFLLLEFKLCLSFVHNQFHSEFRQDRGSLIWILWQWVVIFIGAGQYSWLESWNWGVFLLPSGGLFVNRNENHMHLSFVTTRLRSLFIWGFWALCQTLQIETLLVAIVWTFYILK